MKPLLCRISVLLVLAASLSLSIAERSTAADLQAKPSIRLGQGWDSNIFNTTANEVSDFYFTATPELLLSATMQNYTLQLSGGVEGRWYYDNPDLSAWNYSEYARLSGTGKVTERFSMNPAAYYVRSSDQYQRSLSVPIDPSLPAPDIATYGLQKITNFGASLGVQYLATQTLETGGTVFYAAQDYPDQAVASSDSQTYGASATIRYLFGPGSSLGGYVAANRAEYDVTPDSQVLAVGILGGYQFSPAWKFDGRLGMAFARQEASATAPAETAQDPAGTISLEYTETTFQARIYANVGYSGLSGAGQLERQGTAGVIINDQLTDRWSWNLGGYYQIRRTVFAATNVDTSTLGGTAGIRYAPWEWGSFDLTGRGSREWSDLPNNDLTRYTAVLGFTLGKAYPLY